MKTKILAIAGPTASGKTALSIELAKSFNGEVISCDSMQIYKYMDIGTAKPTSDEMAGVVHHLIDFVEPYDEFSCADYCVLAKQKIDEITLKGKLPIFCGGTGLYLDNVISNTVFSDAGRDDEYRAKLEKELELYGAIRLHEKLVDCDPVSAQKIHPNNTKRVIRALEIYHTTGIAKSEWDSRSISEESPYDSTVICLDYRNRETLYKRIDKRVDIMIENGLLDEVKNIIYEKNIVLSSTAQQGIGYKEIIDYLNGKCSLDEAIERIKQGTRNYAKRQLTWFRRNKKAHFVFVDDFNSFDEVVSYVKNTVMT